MNFSSIVSLRGLFPCADPAKISLVAQELGVSLPEKYVSLITFSDGCLLDNGLCIYKIEDLAERNKTFEIFDYLPGYLLIGDDSGGKGILVSLDPANQRIYESGLGDLNPNDLNLISDSFQSWIDSKFQL